MRTLLDHKALHSPWQDEIYIKALRMPDKHCMTALGVQPVAFTSRRDLTKSASLTLNL